VHLQILIVVVCGIGRETVVLKFNPLNVSYSQRVRGLCCGFNRICWIQVQVTILVLCVEFVFVDLREANTAEVVIAVTTECVSTIGLALHTDHSQHFICLYDFV